MTSHCVCSIDVITEELFFSLSADNKVNGNVEKPWGGKQLVQNPAKKQEKLQQERVSIVTRKVVTVPL